MSQRDPGFVHLGPKGRPRGQEDAGSGVSKNEQENQTPDPQVNKAVIHARK